MVLVAHMLFFSYANLFGGCLRFFFIAKVSILSEVYHKYSNVLVLWEIKCWLFRFLQKYNNNIRLHKQTSGMNVIMRLFD